jgi:tape measure domain-containing protein
MSGLNISFKISAIDDFSAVMHKLHSNLESVSQATQEIGATMTAFGAAMSAAVGVVAKFGIEFNARMEQSKIAWETLLKSTDKATEMQRNLQQLAQTSPFDYEGLDKTAKMMLAMGWNAESLLPDIKSIGDAVSAVGGGTDALERVGLAFAQMSAKGKISAEEMNQLAENGIPAWQLLSQETGKSVQELMKLSENGKLFANETIPLIMKGIQERFGGSMEKASNTFTGQLERMKEVMNQTFGTLTMPLFDMLKSVLPVISSMLQNVATWFSNLSKPMQITLTLIAVLVPLFTLLGGVILLAVGAIGNAITAFSTIAGALGMTTGALAGFIGIAAAVVAGIVALGAAFVIAYQKVDWFRNFVDQAWAQIKSYFQTALTFIQGIVSQVMSAVSSFINEKLAQIRAFWQQNGEQIKRAATIVWAFLGGFIRAQMAVIQAVITVAWNVIKSVTSAVWNTVKDIISGGLNMILGIIKTFSSILTGDWRGAWEGVKQITKGAIQALGSIVNGVVDIGKNIIKGLIKGITSAASGLYEKAKEIARNVTKTIKNALDIHSPSRVMMELGQFTGEGFAIGLNKTLRDINVTADRLAYAAVPSVEPSDYQAGGTTIQQPINITLNYNGSGSPADAYQMVDILERELGNHIGSRLRLSGVKA